MNSNLYTEQFLLNRCYDKLDQVKGNGPKKLNLAKPNVITKDSKTFYFNFVDMSKKLNRSVDHVQNFFDVELNVSSSVDINGTLIISGMYQPIKVHNVLMKYIASYIKCKQCNFYDTEITKDNKIVYMNCKNCKSKNAII